MIFLYGRRFSRCPAAISELILGRRHLLGDREQDVIRQHVVTRLVVESGHEVSPLEQHLQDSQLVERVRVPASLHYCEVVVVLDHGLLVDLEGQGVTFVASRAQKGLGVQSVTSGALFKQVDSDSVVDVEEIVRVLPCIFLHLVGQRPHTPVRELVLLVCENGAVDLKKVGEAELLVANSPCRLPSIKHIDKVQTEVPLQPFNILICSMEHLND